MQLQMETSFETDVCLSCGPGELRTLYVQNWRQRAIIRNFYDVSFLFDIAWHINKEEQAERNDI